MYAFVDQPVATLAPAARFVLWAMRGWIHAAARGTCPPGQLAPGFARAGALPALAPTHRLLAVLNRAARGELAFAPLAFDQVVEDEAVLLQLWQDAAVAPARARATLALLLDVEAVPPTLSALIEAGALLARAGLPVAAMADGGAGA